MTKGKPGADAGVDGESAAPKRSTQPLIGSPVLAIGLAVGLVLALPLLDAFGSMPGGLLMLLIMFFGHYGFNAQTGEYQGGLLTLLIMFFGLQQAWKQTAPDVAMVAGPYQNSTS